MAYSTSAMSIHYDETEPQSLTAEDRTKKRAEAFLKAQRELTLARDEHKAAADKMSLLSGRLNSATLGLADDMESDGRQIVATDTGYLLVERVGMGRIPVISVFGLDGKEIR